MFRSLSQGAGFVQENCIKPSNLLQIKLIACLPFPPTLPVFASTQGPVQRFNHYQDSTSER